MRDSSKGAKVNGPLRLQTIIRRVSAGVAPGPMGGARGLARVWVVPLAAVVLAVVVAPPAYAAAGDLDPAFGTGGLVVTDFGSNADSARDVALQSDGKIVRVGVGCVTARKSEVPRYKPDRPPGPSFGSGGLTHF